jgi:hypothetical protein
MSEGMMQVMSKHLRFDLFAQARSVPRDQLYRWAWRAKLPERRGQLFRVLALATKNSCLIGFISDGARLHQSERHAAGEDRHRRDAAIR